MDLYLTNKKTAKALKNEYSRIINRRNSVIVIYTDQHHLCLSLCKGVIKADIYRKRINLALV